MEQATVKAARLDHDQVYWGLLTKALEELKEGDLVFCTLAMREQLPVGVRWVDVDCDLPAGQQKWNAEKGCFQPLPRSLRKNAPDAITSERALYELLKGMHERDPASVPGASVEWALGFEKTVDAILTAMDDAQLSLNYFHAATGRKRK
jgi:hypothetical protein